MTQREKAEIVLDKLGRISINRERREADINAVCEALDLIEEKEPTRTLKEVQVVVDAVRAGIPVQVDYADLDEDNEYIAKACW